MRSAQKPDSTIGLRLYQLRRLAESFLDRDPWSLTLDELAAWIGSNTWAKETARGYRAAIRQFYNWAHVTGRIAVNPAALLPPITPNQGKPHPAPEDIYRAAIAGEPDDRVRLMLELAGGVGMRRAEIAVATANDAHLDADGWAMLVHGKGGKERVVPLSDSLAARIRRWPHRGYLFPGQIDGHLSPRYVGKLMSRAIDGEWTAHSLRHRFAGRAYAAERDIRAVQELLGHASVRTTQIYTPVPTGALRTAALAAA